MIGDSSSCPKQKGLQREQCNIKFPTQNDGFSLGAHSIYSNLTYKGHFLIPKKDQPTPQSAPTFICGAWGAANCLGFGYIPGPFMSPSSPKSISNVWVSDSEEPELASNVRPAGTAMQGRLGGLGRLGRLSCGRVPSANKPLHLRQAWRQDGALIHLASLFLQQSSDAKNNPVQYTLQGQASSTRTQTRITSSMKRLLNLLALHSWKLYGLDAEQWKKQGAPGLE